MATITLKTSDLKGDRVILFPAFVSNGYWMTHLDRVTNRQMFASEDLCRAFAPGAECISERLGDEDARKGREVMPTGTLTEIRPTGLIYRMRRSFRDSRPKDVLIYHGEGVGFVGFDARHVALMGLDGAPLWIKYKESDTQYLTCAINTPDRDTATVAIMPFDIGSVMKWLRSPQVATSPVDVAAAAAV